MPFKIKSQNFDYILNSFEKKAEVKPTYTSINDIRLFKLPNKNKKRQLS